MFFKHLSNSLDDLLFVVFLKLDLMIRTSQNFDPVSVELGLVEFVVILGLHVVGFFRDVFIESRCLSYSWWYCIAEGRQLLLDGGLGSEIRQALDASADIFFEIQERVLAHLVEL